MVWILCSTPHLMFCGWQEFTVSKAHNLKGLLHFIRIIEVLGDQMPRSGPGNIGCLAGTSHRCLGDAWLLQGTHLGLGLAWYSHVWRNKQKSRNNGPKKSIATILIIPSDWRNKSIPKPNLYSHFFHLAHVSWLWPLRAPFQRAKRIVPSTRSFQGSLPSCRSSNSMVFLRISAVQNQTKISKTCGFVGVLLASSFQKPEKKTTNNILVVSFIPNKKVSNILG